MPTNAFGFNLDAPVIGDGVACCPAHQPCPSASAVLQQCKPDDQARCVDLQCPGADQ